MAKKCPNCGSHDLRREDGKMICNWCGEVFEEETFNDFLAQKERSYELLSTLVEDNWPSLRKQVEAANQNIEEYQQEINDLKQQVKDAEALLEKTKTLNQEQLNQLIDKMPALAVGPNANKDSVLQSIKDVISATFNHLSDKLVDSLKLKPQASDANITKLAKNYTIPMLIDCAADNSTDSFAAPAALLRKSVERAIKNVNNIATRGQSIFINKDGLQKIYDEVHFQPFYGKYKNECYRALMNSDIIPKCEDFKTHQNEILEVDEVPYYGAGNFLRLWNTHLFSDPDSIELAIRYWDTLNLFIHDRAIETISKDKKKSVKLSEWVDDDLKQRKAMFVTIYSFFKKHGVHMIGD